ncbi:UDP-N-acetylmuramate:L-alanyl-gamma-D-glutamyl-meso-diaminopimelate ligase [Longibacter salinarum]|uniref:UDP-N-acetylmuramate:L-alanyl-gamma-D-glutamyl-meso-diaminopimelate ligase n=1 Tax=Longibacter salinarum TaxID=1850348 RepID=A0A2A8CTJ8_9BACT|nr:Mur ligase family protein [Longibacter salinarum]PEN10393.1 UDP-N-acetylmuramate:L-alanyl-gamma-D-glutamyl-meso-diaminopimelate ligase [Longibacter salinarum]
MRSIHSFPDAELRTFDRPDLPPADELDNVYLIGICGTGMGALAGLFKEAGCSVRGSDESVYPPMSTHLAERNIEVMEGYDPAHLDPAPDLVVVGNACTPTHPEAAAARERGLVQASFPEALSHYFLQHERRRSLVVAGTHGKTTTTGLLIHVLQSADADPGFLVGGVMQNTGRSYALGSDQPFVVEGDEYDSAYFDKQPKMMHYVPDRAIITSMEFDHADIYEDETDYRSAFEAFAGTLDPRDGILVLCGDDPDVRALANHTDARTRTYGLSDGNDISARDISVTENGISFTLTMGGLARGSYTLPMHGRHNLQNALAVATLAFTEGCSPAQIAEGFASWEGMKRRQEVRGEVGGVLVLDDFAHHPTAVRATIDGIRAAYPNRRLVAIFEPRSNSSRRKVFEQAYGDAFASADVAYLKAPPVRHNDDADAMLDPEAVVRRIEHHDVPAHAFDNTDALLHELEQALQSNDLALIMSNGSFDGLHERLLKALRERT